MHRTATSRLTRGLAAGLLLAGLLLVSAPPAQAVKLAVNDDIFVNLNLLLQPWVQLSYTKNAKFPAGAGADAQAAALAPDTQSDAFMRRTRILLGGQVSKWVSFFMETDMPNLGKGGVWSATDYNGDGIVDANSFPFIVQDAYVRFNIHPAFNIATGMLLPAFGRNFFTSAAKLHGYDYHAKMAKYPTPTSWAWRDNGIAVSGVLLKSKLEYRFSATQGATQVLHDVPRFTGRVSYSLLDSENGAVYLPGATLGTSKILSVGIAGDVQPNAYRNATSGERGTYYGVTGDVFWDLPMRGGKHALTGLFGVVYYGGELHPEKGVGVLFDVGYAIGRWEPMITVDWYKPDGAKDGLTGQMLMIHPGLNFWLHGHTANLKLDLGVDKAVGTKFDNASLVGTLATQLFF